MRETIDHGKTGYLANSFEEFVGNVIMFRDKSEQEKKVMRESCVERAKLFSLQKMIDRVEQLCIEAKETGGW